MKNLKFISGKASFLALLAGALVASFLLGKTLTSVSATTNPWVDVGSCVADCGTSEGQQKQEKTTITRVCDQGCPNYTFTTSRQIVDVAEHWSCNSDYELYWSNQSNKWRCKKEIPAEYGWRYSNKVKSDWNWDRWEWNYVCPSHDSDYTSTNSSKPCSMWVKIADSYEDRVNATWVPNTYTTEDYSKTFTYEKSSDPNHCHKPTPVTLEIPEWARSAYGSTVPELADFIELNCHNDSSTETREIDCVASIVECSASCGNSVTETGEQCDDGNTNDGDGCSATCTLEESTDYCANLEGDQTTLPDGMEVVRENFCQCKEGYDEVNQDGEKVAQDGLSNFTCVAKEPTPTPSGDLCTNIDGIQTSVPDGMHINATGHECVNYELGGAPAPQGGSTNTQVLGISTSVSSGQVLGASTMGGAGSFDGMLYQAIMGLGGIITSFGLKKALRKAN